MQGAKRSQVGQQSESAMPNALGIALVIETIKRNIRIV
jgi:hypothetical protein